MTRLAYASDGETVAYRIHGAPGATPLITVHGLVSSIEHWQFFTPYYAAKRPVVSWEYRGHGGRPAPRDPATVTIPHFAEDAYAVMRAAELPPSIVVGLSFGVQVALELWRAHRDAVRALVLICGTAGHPLDRVSSSPLVRRFAADVVRGMASTRFLAEPVLSFLRSKQGTKLACELAYLSGGAHRDACPDEVLQHLFAHAGALAPEVIGAITASYFEHSAWDVLPTITVPTLIIAGDKDQLTPVATAERMHRAIPNSELVVFPGHSHLVQVEKPHEVHAAIDAFLQRHAL
ncbi:MAG TPA: alpha/beta hydrolase [Kofleriaceae bacterium]|nr:alpha/beta hydrolase [Kofleriaceae bacterium]